MEVGTNLFILSSNKAILFVGIEEDFEEEDDDYSDAVYMKNKLSDDESKFGQFFCRTCGMSFHRQDNLKRHQRVHVKEEFANENEFGHICNVCGESFPEALDLLAHAEVCNNSNKVLYIKQKETLWSFKQANNNYNSKEVKKSNYRFVLF